MYPASRSNFLDTRPSSTFYLYFIFLSVLGATYDFSQNGWQENKGKEEGEVRINASACRVGINDALLKIQRKIVLKGCISIQAFCRASLMVFYL